MFDFLERDPLHLHKGLIRYYLEMLNPGGSSSFGLDGLRTGPHEKLWRVALDGLRTGLRNDVKYTFGLAIAGQDASLLFL
jgi:hypothetical protein